MPVFRKENLEAFTQAVFERSGYGEEEAGLIARLIVRSNLAGHDSHGVRQIPRYLERIRIGHVVPGAPVTVERETAATAVLDGHRALGHVAATRAVELGIAKARETKISVVTVRNLDHVGRAGAYPEMAAEAGMVCLSFVCAQRRGRSVAPHGGIEGRLGTNPLGAAFPNPTGDPILLDFATSVVAANKIRQALDRGMEAGEGWIMDKAGNPTRDPKVFTEGNGAMLPLGGSVGYKGFGLSVLVDLIAGVLSGAGTADSRPEMLNNGTLLITIEPEAFIAKEDYERQVGELAAYLRATATPPGSPPVMLPGEYEQEHRRRREAEGIEIEEPVWRNIRRAVAGLEVTLPESVPASPTPASG